MGIKNERHRDGASPAMLVSRVAPDAAAASFTHRNPRIELFRVAHARAGIISQEASCAAVTAKCKAVNKDAYLNSK